MSLPNALPEARRRQRLIQREVQRLEGVLTPQEFLDRAAEEEAGGKADLASEMRASATMAFLSRQARLEPFRRRVLAQEAALYEGEAASSERSLLVGFCGMADRLMLPLPMILQHLPARRWDVLLLTDSRRAHYRKGCLGFADSLPDLVRRVAALSDGYARCVALGTSMGGLAAVAVARLAAMERGISIGGRPPNPVLHLRSRDGALPAFDPLCACLPSSSGRFVFTYSGGHADDAVEARRYAPTVGGCDLPIPGLVGHNLLHALQEKGVLADFLDLVLDAPVLQLPLRMSWIEARASEEPGPGQSVLAALDRFWHRSRAALRATRYLR
jgi:hypothetical protein